MSEPDSLKRLIESFGRLPGIGGKTATRLAYWLVHADKEYARTLAKNIVDVKEKISLCSVCQNLTENDPCRICSDTARDKTLICVVEGPSEMTAVEKTGKFRGLYHVLHGNLSPLDGIGPSAIKIKELVSRVSSGVIKEVIIATSPTVEGEGTAVYVKDLLKPLKVRVTRIASGVPMGGDLKFVDELTLSSAMEGRREY
jgi:recombination protein RecR